MKKLVIASVFSLLFNMSINAQFAEFRSIQKPFNPQQEQSNNETKIVKGYVISDSGEVTKLIQLKINNSNGVIRIIAYYRVDPLFGSGSWVSLQAQLSVRSLSGIIPLTIKEKVAYANFTYSADGYHLDANDIVWFNM